MKYQVMMGILFTLLKNRRATAQELAARFDISPRSVYRYIEEMTVAGIPIDVARGQYGGIYISAARAGASIFRTPTSCRAAF